MNPELEEQENDIALEQSVNDEQRDVVDAANEVLPTLRNEGEELRETLNESDINESSSEEESHENEVVSVEEQREAQAEGVPIPEEEIITNEKIEQMRNSNFAKAVAKGSLLQDVSEKSLIKTTANYIADKRGAREIGAAALLTGGSVYNICDTYNSKKEGDAPTNARTDDKGIAISWATSLLLSVLSIIKVYNLIKSNDNTSTKILKSIPNLLGVLCNIADSCIVSAAKNTMKTKNTLNFLAPAKTFLCILDCIGDHTDVTQRKKKLQSMIEQGVSDREKMKPVIDKLSRLAKDFLPNIFIMGARALAELSYAISYAKNPTSTTTYGLKFAANGMSAAQTLSSIYFNHNIENAVGPNQTQKNLSNTLYGDFTALYTNANIYLGSGEEATVLDTLEKKQTALQAYENTQDELDATGVSFYALAHADDRQEQQKIILDAVGY